MQRLAAVHLPGQGGRLDPARTVPASAAYAPSMRIFVTGATGLIGRRLVLDRLERGDQVVLLSRDVGRARAMFAAEANPNVTVVQGDPVQPGAWQAAVNGCDAVIHLAGAGITDRRWSERYKRLLADSRIEGTRQVVAAIDAVARKPAVLVSGSAVGYYGDTAGRATDETAPRGTGFLAELTERWEQQAIRAAGPATRVVLLRTGVILDDRGGALPQMMRPFRCFAGGPIGSGRQYLPWIHWRDEIGIIDMALRDRHLSGPMNACAPNAVTSRDFASALGVAMRRPALAPAVPWAALRIVLGELADELVKSSRVVPAVAARCGYQFLYPLLEPALRDLLTPPTDSTSATPRGNARSPARVAPPRAGVTVNAGAADGAVKPQRPPAPVKLLAIDIDGTLLTSSGRLAPTVVAAVRAAERAGCMVVLATGRPPRAVRSILQTLGTQGLTINHHGALVWNPAVGAHELHQPLDIELTRDIVAAARSALPELLIGLEIVDRWFTDQFDPLFAAEHMRIMHPDGIQPLDEVLTQPITKLNLLREPARLRTVLDALHASYIEPKRVVAHFTNPHLLQLTSSVADKGAALRWIAERNGWAREQVMAVGDAANDLGMIRWAGFGVAVANASREVCDAADVVVEANDQHGVAFAIQRYVLM
jgi:uncharacterized protein